MDKLYAEYGKLMVQREIIEGRIMEVKKKLQQALSEEEKKCHQEK